MRCVLPQTTEREQREYIPWHHMDFSAHARFNQLERIYCNMANGVERLCAMVADHFRHVCPENVALEPPVMKRKKREEYA